jgi:hypothetical protein
LPKVEAGFAYGRERNGGKRRALIVMSAPLKDVVSAGRRVGRWGWSTSRAAPKRTSVSQIGCFSQTPEALGAPAKADAERWWPLIKEFGIKAE